MTACVATALYCKPKDHKYLLVVMANRACHIWICAGIANKA